MDLVEDFAEPGVSIVAACSSLWRRLGARRGRFRDDSRDPSFDVAVMLLFRADGHDQLARTHEGSVTLELAERAPHVLPSGVAPRSIERRQHLM